MDKNINAHTMSTVHDTLHPVRTVVSVRRLTMDTGLELGAKEDFRGWGDGSAEKRMGCCPRDPKPLHTPLSWIWYPQACVGTHTHIKIHIKINFQKKV